MVLRALAPCRHEPFAADVAPAQWSSEAVAALAWFFAEQEPPAPAVYAVLRACAEHASFEAFTAAAEHALFVEALVADVDASWSLHATAAVVPEVAAMVRANRSRASFTEHLQGLKTVRRMMA
jgi:hypothetical protein